ncbi:hypothetical protein HY732_01985 [Candidatus Uhrbacteria bacterium]|nr:hypothetical protein [Candidatus Uhrbacteria bacterium]
MPGLFERMGSLFGGEEEARRPRRDADRGGRRISREHPTEFRDILQQQLREARKRESPLFHLKNIKKAESELLPALEDRIDRQELGRTARLRARPLVEGILQGIVPPRKKRTIPVSASKGGRPEYSPALLAQLDYGRHKKHGSLRLRMGEMILAAERIRDALLRLTRETKKELERASSQEEKDRIRDAHRHARLSLIREIKTTQTEFLGSTKQLDAFLQSAEQQKEKPSFFRDALESARDFLSGSSKKGAPKTAAPLIRKKQAGGRAKKAVKGSARGVEGIPEPLAGLGQAVQQVWSRLSGTKKPHATFEELYTAIEQSIAGISDIEEKVAARVQGAPPATGEPPAPPQGDQDDGTQKQPADSESKPSSDEKAAVFTPLASRILGREELKGISPDGLRAHIMDRLLAITQSTVLGGAKFDLMTKDEFEKSITTVIQDSSTTYGHLDEFYSFLTEEINQLNSNPQSTTFKGGVLLAIFTRTVQIVGGERNMRLHSGKAIGDFLGRAGVIEKKEMIDGNQFRELLEAYIQKPERTDSEIAGLLGKLRIIEVLWTSEAFGDLNERLAPVAGVAREIIQKELDRRKNIPSARGRILFRLGFSVREDQPIPQEQFEEALVLWLSEPGRDISEFQKALDVITDLAKQEKDNQHIQELYKNVSARISVRIDAPAPPKREAVIDIEYGKLLKALGIQALETPVSPDAAQVHVDTWLAGVPNWSDDQLRTAFAAVNVLILKEGMAGIHEEDDSSPLLPFLKAMSSYLKEERGRRPSFALGAGKPPDVSGAIAGTQAQERVGWAGAEDASPKQAEAPIPLQVQPTVIRGSILRRFDIPGADVAVGKKYFTNRLNEWLALSRTTTAEKERFRAFCEDELTLLAAMNVGRKTEKESIFNEAIRIVGGDK